MSSTSPFFFPKNIKDGYTRKATLAASPGIFPEFKITFRPALHAERQEYLMLADAAFAAKRGQVDLELLAKHVKTFNGEPFAEMDLANIFPPIVQPMINAVLSYTPAEEEGDAKN